MTTKGKKYLYILPRYSWMFPKAQSLDLLFYVKPRENKFMGEKVQHHLKFYFFKG